MSSACRAQTQTAWATFVGDDVFESESHGLSAAGVSATWHEPGADEAVQVPPSTMKPQNNHQRWRDTADDT